MRTIILVLAAAVAMLTAAVVAWRRDPRMGSAYVNETLNPWLLRRGLAGGRHSEIGTLEHRGRTTGIRRLTPVHPEPTDEGFRFIVPLGTQSQWARNVMAAGGCRIQLHGRVYELGEPRLVPASEIDDLPRPMRALLSCLGSHYLRMRTLDVRAGTLEA